MRISPVWAMAHDPTMRTSPQHRRPDVSGPVEDLARVYFAKPATVLPAHRGQVGGRQQVRNGGGVLRAAQLGVGQHDPGRPWRPPQDNRLGQRRSGRSYPP